MHRIRKYYSHRDSTNHNGLRLIILSLVHSSERLSFGALFYAFTSFILPLNFEVCGDYCKMWVSKSNILVQGSQGCSLESSFMSLLGTCCIVFFTDSSFVLLSKTHKNIELSCFHSFLLYLLYIVQERVVLTL